MPPTRLPISSNTLQKKGGGRDGDLEARGKTSRIEEWKRAEGGVPDLHKKIHKKIVDFEGRNYVSQLPLLSDLFSICFFQIHIAHTSTIVP